MNEKDLQGADIKAAQALGKTCLCFKPTHHTPHKTREIHAITHGAEELGDSPQNGGAGLRGRTATGPLPRGPGRSHRPSKWTAWVWRKRSGGSHRLGKWFLALSSIIGQNNGHTRAKVS